MVSKKMHVALNKQIGYEFSSAYLYLSMSAHFHAVNLPGFAHWMNEQYKEEMGHGMKFFSYIYERGGKVELEAIDKPPSSFKNPLDIFKQVLDHEKKVSGTINALYELALKESDYPSQVMLHWFIAEQVEEEKAASDIIEQLKMIGDAPAGLMMLDRQLAARS
ncbi:MAG TPA: ferritin [Bacteroidetes bacterium]|nr:ferritin [Bacteroidota bacterium]